MDPENPGVENEGKNSSSPEISQTGSEEIQVPATGDSTDDATTFLPLSQSKNTQTDQEKPTRAALKLKAESISSKSSLTSAQVLKEFIVSSQLATENNRREPPVEQRKPPLALKGVIKKGKTESGAEAGDQATSTDSIDPNSKSAQVDIQTEDEAEEELEPLKGCDKCLYMLKKTKGLYLALFCSLQFSLCVYLAYRLIHLRKFSPIHIIVFRFAGCFVLCSIIIPYFQQKHNILAKVWPLSKKAKRCSSLKILIRCVCGCGSLICQFYALKYIEPADVAVILFSNPVFVALGAHLFLGEKCGFFHIVLALLAILGVVIVSKPPFITGGEEYTKEKMYGIGLAIAAMFLSTSTMILMRILKNIHFSIINACFGFIGLIIAIILGTSTGELMTLQYKSFSSEDYTLFICITLFTFTGLCTSTLAFKYAEAGPVSIVRSSEVIFTFLWQMISNIFPDGASLGGASIVLVCILLTGFRQYLSSVPKERKIRRIFWFVLR